jgi:hypothetical protein
MIEQTRDLYHWHPPCHQEVRRPIFIYLHYYAYFHRTCKQTLIFILPFPPCCELQIHVSATFQIASCSSLDQQTQQEEGLFTNITDGGASLYSPINRREVRSRSVFKQLFDQRPAPPHVSRPSRKKRLLPRLRPQVRFLFASPCVVNSRHVFRQLFGRPLVPLLINRPDKNVKFSKTAHTNTLNYSPIAQLAINSIYV